MKKYELTNETKLCYGRTLHRIVALRYFDSVKKGDKGGWIETEENLSHEGKCWVYDEAKVFENAKVCGNAVVCGNAEVGGDAEIYNNKDYIVFKNWWSSGRYFTWIRSNNMWLVGCFYGTGDKLIKKAYADSEDKGKHYAEIVEYVNKCVLKNK